MIIARNQRGHLAISQQAHAEMCGEIGRAWGGRRFPLPAEPASLLAAASGHELGMLEWDRRPSLQPRRGLPASVKEMDPAEHLPLRRLSVDRLAAEDERAALICSLHHTSFYERPRTLALLLRRHRLVRRYLDDEGERQRLLRQRLAADEDLLQREWRLLRCWDAISHALVLERAPTTIEAVPDSDGELAAVAIDRAGPSLTAEPWPFAAETVELAVAGRLLAGPYPNRREMQRALDQAPEVELRYELRPR